MEGISHEACSLAGTLKLGKLIVVYDDNDISIDGEVSGWFTEDIPKRFESYGWHVIPNIDGHDSIQIDKAFEQAKENLDRPSIICCKTKIGKGSPNKAGTASVHGTALGEEEVVLTRKELNWEHSAFVIPDEIYLGWDAKEVGSSREDDWKELFVKTGYGYSCDPDDSEDIKEVLMQLYINKDSLFDIGERNRQKILNDWNYNFEFKKIEQFL